MFFQIWKKKGQLHSEYQILIFEKTITYILTILVIRNIASFIVPTKYTLVRAIYTETKCVYFMWKPYFYFVGSSHKNMRQKMCIYALKNLFNLMRILNAFVVNAN